MAISGTKKDQIKLLGNAMKPPVAEVIVSALAEAITGEVLERFVTRPAFPEPPSRQHPRSEYWHNGPGPYGRQRGVGSR